jgi:hypothetical protein
VKKLERCLIRTERGPVMVPFSLQNAGFTPKGERVNELRAEGKSFDEAFAIADREFTVDGLLPRRGTADLDAVLSGGIEQTGQVQF